MTEKFEKWDKHKVGSVKWINKHKDHPHRDRFINYVLQDPDIVDILEIGGGELIEAREIVRRDPRRRYHLCDVSESFIEFANSLCLFENVYKMSMHDLDLPYKIFDLVYLSSVLEHTPDISRTIRNISQCSKRFYITMFKWKEKTGDLISNFNVQKEYFSTMFNLPMVLETINEYGIIEDMTVSFASTSVDGETEVSYADYKKHFIEGSDEWRNGDRLNIVGQWK